MSSATATQVNSPSQPQAEQIANQLAQDLMSPYCPGRTIATCPSPAARTLEREILSMAESGKTRDEIETELVSRFPDIQGYLGRPDLIYGTLVLALLAIAALVMISRRWIRQGQAARGGASATTPSGGPANAREMDALDDALDRVDGFS
ncbi:MAG: cytochrome c-type biogenesis protein CcmH [Myxococcales bacterium]|nr:cytochrome c-type biogenesis protein CcmH [Myxococcales bacterium]MCB9749481.1 cytochrome c-type biogenesis protein CcmH [Myxococcales bacterium]